MKLERVKSVEQLCALADDRKSIIGAVVGCRVPAAFLQNWPGRILVGVVARGLYVYDGGKISKLRTKNPGVRL